MRPLRIPDQIGEQFVDQFSPFGIIATDDAGFPGKGIMKYNAVPADTQPAKAIKRMLLLKDIALAQRQLLQRIAQTFTWFRSEGTQEIGDLRGNLNLR